MAAISAVLDLLDGAAASSRETAETAVVLELGAKSDSRAFLHGLAPIGVVDATPLLTPDDSVFPTPPDDSPVFDHEGPSPTWIEHFVRQTPTWAYLSGHYTGEFYNTAENFTLDFTEFREATNPLIKAYSHPDTSGYGLNKRCAVVFMVGCRAVDPDYRAATLRLQRLFGPYENPTRVPPLLGFADTCPDQHTGGTAPLVAAFMRNLRRQGRPFVERDVAQAWLDAAKDWNNETHKRNVGWLDSSRQAHAVSVSRGRWSWKAIGPTSLPDEPH